MTPRQNDLHWLIASMTYAEMMDFARELVGIYDGAGGAYGAGPSQERRAAELSSWANEKHRPADLPGMTDAVS